MRKLTMTIFYLALVACTSFVLLDTFVLQSRISKVSSSVTTSTKSSSTTSTNAATTSSTDTTSNQVSVKTYRENDTNIYVADIYLKDGETIQSALADNTYGKNITDTTSNIASSVGSTIAINGDNYGSRNSGYVVRNGELLRADKASDDQEDLVLLKNGSMKIIKEGDVTAQELVDQGALQVLSFGPGLIIDSELSVDADDEVGKAMASNPRTALGYLGDNHYVMVVADGRTSESTGLSLLQIAEFMQTLGVKQAYNLDGGGSSTMYYNGEVTNKPTTNGNQISERSVTDVLYLQ